MKRGQKFRSQVLRRQPWCSRCARATGLRAHHVVALMDGGADSLENGDTLCHGCHTEWHLMETAIAYADFLSTVPGFYLVNLQRLAGLDDLTWGQIKDYFRIILEDRFAANRGEPIPSGMPAHVVKPLTEAERIELEEMEE